MLAQSVAGQPVLLVRFNETARKWEGHPDLSLRVGFAVPLSSPNPGSLPSAEENEALAAVEDIVIEEVLSRAVGFHALALTNGEMKEFVFYISEGVDIRQIHMAVRSRVPTYDIQCMAVRDRDWQSYKEFAP